MSNRLSYRLVVACLVLAFGATSEGARADDSGPTTIFFVNGVTTTVDDAATSALELRRQWESHSPNLKDGVNFALAYNPTDGAMKDLIESGLQSGIAVADLMRMIQGAIPADPFVKAKLQEWVDFTQSQPEKTSRIVDKFVHAYQLRLDQKQKVILVPHSQGNFFANEEYRRLPPLQRKCTHLVAVATPDSVVADNGSWITLDDDDVIIAASAARALAGTPTLPSNTAHSFSQLDLPGNSWGHAFLSAYLVPDTKSRSKIFAAMDAARVAERPIGSSCGEASQQPYSYYYELSADYLQCGQSVSISFSGVIAGSAVSDSASYTADTCSGFGRFSTKPIAAGTSSRPTDFGGFTVTSTSHMPPGWTDAGDQARCYLDIHVLNPAGEDVTPFFAEWAGDCKSGVWH